MKGRFILKQNGRIVARLAGEILVPEGVEGATASSRPWELYLDCDTAAWAHDGASFQIIGPSRRSVPGMAVCHDNGVLLVVGSGSPP